MLISFTLGNWRSFPEETTLTMKPGTERRFDWTLARFRSGQRRLLPIAVLYGANASGKTNFISGMKFLVNFVQKAVRMEEDTGVSQNILEQEKEKEPTIFSCIFRTCGTTFEYTIRMTKKEVLFEELIRHVADNKTCTIFRREKDKKFIFCNNSKRAHFVYDGTRDNIAYIANAHSQKIAEVEKAYQWFESKVVFIDEKTHNGIREKIKRDSCFNASLNEHMAEYDTGIEEIENVPCRPVAVSTMERGKAHISVDPSGGIVSFDVLRTRHVNNHDMPVYLDFYLDESEGTKRLFSLLPILIHCEKSLENHDGKAGHCRNTKFEKDDMVFIVDEIDSSMHVNLLHKFIYDFLSLCSFDSRFQLIATTHNTCIMNQKLLRRDEIWIVDRQGGSSTLFSLSSFRNLRFDTVIERLYREGYLGGTPHVVARSLPEKKTSRM